MTKKTAIITIYTVLLAMILAAVIIIAYTSMGGFLAASFTDLIQSIVMGNIAGSFSGLKPLRPPCMSWASRISASATEERMPSWKCQRKRKTSSLKNGTR